MKLDFLSIAYILEDQFSVIEKNTVKEGRLYDYPLFFENETLPEEHVIYIASADDIIEAVALPSSSVLICLGKPAFELTAAMSYIILEASADKQTVFNTLQKTLRHICQACQELNHLYIKGKGVQSLLDAMLPLFDNPIYVHDKNYRMFAYAENRDNPLQNWTYDFYYGGSLSAETIKRLTQSPRFASTFQTTYPTYYEKDAAIEDYDYLYVNLRNNGQYIGRLFIDEKLRKINPLDYILLDELRHYIELIMTQSKSASTSDNRQLVTNLSQLSDGHILNRHTLSSVRQDLGWPESYRYRCLQLSIAVDDDYRNISIALCELLNAKIDNCFAFPYGAGILVLLSAKNQTKTLLDTWFLPISHNFDLTIGVSRVFHDLTQLSLAVRQTTLSLTYADRRTTRISYYNDHLLDYVVSATLETLPVSMICPQSLLDLIAFDRANHTEYVKTLAVYLAADLSPTKASEKLYIHRSSFLYRLERILEITHEDFHDPDVQTLYRYIFYLFKKMPDQFNTL